MSLLPPHGASGLPPRAPRNDVHLRLRAQSASRWQGSRENRAPLCLYRTRLNAIQRLSACSATQRGSLANGVSAQISPRGHVVETKHGLKLRRGGKQTQVRRRGFLRLSHGASAPLGRRKRQRRLDLQSVLRAQSSRVRREEGSEGGGGAKSRKEASLMALVEAQKVIKSWSCAHCSLGLGQSEGREQGWKRGGRQKQKSDVGLQVKSDSVKEMQKRGGVQVVWGKQRSKVRVDWDWEGSGAKSKNRKR